VDEGFSHETIHAPPVYWEHFPNRVAGVVLRVSGIVINLAIHDPRFTLYFSHFMLCLLICWVRPFARGFYQTSFFA